MLSPLSLSSVGVPSQPTKGFTSLTRHHSEGVGIKRTTAQKNWKDAEENAPELTNGRKLQRRNELNVTMPPRFHRLVG